MPDPVPTIISCAHFKAIRRASLSILYTLQFPTWKATQLTFFNMEGTRGVKERSRHIGLYIGLAFVDVRATHGAWCDVRLLSTEIVLKGLR